MKIKKTDERVTYQQMVKVEEFEVNGKKVEITRSFTDSDYGDHDDDYDIDELDRSKLTPEEAEELQDSIDEVLDLETGEEIDTEKPTNDHK